MAVLLLVLASSSLTAFRAARAGQPLRHPRAVVSLNQAPPPPEVIEAEANATPNRKYRLAGAAILGGLALASGGLSIATLLGQENAVAVSQDVLLFGNPYLSIAVDVAVVGLSGWAWQQEQLTKGQNIARIWEEVQRRRNMGDTSAGINRSQRRFKNKMESKRAKKVDGFERSRPAPTSAPSPSAPPVVENTTPTPQPPPEASTSVPPEGLAEQAKRFFAEADALGRANALALNSELEARGVLPKLEAPAKEDPAPTEGNGAGTEIAKADTRPTEANQPRGSMTQQKKGKKSKGKKGRK